MPKKTETPKPLKSGELHRPEFVFPYVDAHGDVTAVVDKTLDLLRDGLSRLPVWDSIHIHAEVEQDAELTSWKYGVITVEIEGGSKTLAHLREKEDALLDEVYSQLTPEEATKALIVFDYVQSP